ncbi:MAG: DUF4231 domain-containing protein [Prevotellaceae bacterium]|nr:DUF4231 domain-containing protein [Prevotellaceae bacterium]
MIDKQIHNRYYYKPGGIVIVISGLIVALIILVICLGLQDFPVTVFILLVAIALIPIVIALLLSPIYIEFKKDCIELGRIIAPEKIPYSEITVIKKIDRNELKGSIHLFGSGGLGGFFDIFHNKKLGRYFIFTNSRNNLVYIELWYKKKYVINCPDEFFNCIQEKMNV